MHDEFMQKRATQFLLCGAEAFGGHFCDTDIKAEINFLSEFPVNEMQWVQQYAALWCN